MAVKKIPLDDPPADSSSSKEESETESEDEPIVDGKQAEAESSSEEEEAETDDFMAKPRNVKRNPTAEPSREAAKRQKKTTPTLESATPEGRKSGVVPKSPAREDQWSEEATVTLIDEWGTRYKELKKLQKKDWKEVADAVNALHGHRRTALQCKNRIDTIKKKYKIEKDKPDSTWPFLGRTDSLLGPANDKPEEDTCDLGSISEKKPSKCRLYNGEASASKRHTRKETEPMDSTPVVEDDDWVVLLGELLEERAVPERVWRHGMSRITADEKADHAAKWKEIFLAQLELDARKDQLTSTLKRRIFESLTTDKQTDDGH